MKAAFVADLLTPLERDETVAALRAASITVNGSAAPDAALAVFFAQVWLETGGKYCHRFNVGNLKAASDYDGYFTCFRCNEVVGGKLEWYDPTTGGFSVPPGHPTTRFRAYMTLAQGIADYLDELKNRSWFHSAWLAAMAGNPAEYSHALKVAGYYTANEALYTRGVVALFSEGLRLALSKPWETQPQAIPVAPSQPADARSPHTDADAQQAARALQETMPQFDWLEFTADRDTEVP